MRSRWILYFIIFIIGVSLFIDIPIPAFKILGKTFQINFPLKLGLDLQGGTELILETQMDKIDPANRDSALESAREVIERRVNLYGVSESLVQSSKTGNTRRILVELPGLKDASAAAKLVGSTAQLDFRELPATFSAQELEATKSGIPLIFFAKETGLTGADLKKATVTFGGNNGTSGPQVAIEFSDAGGKKFAEITKRSIGKQLPIFLDGSPISTPVVQHEILGGNAVITGQFTTDEAKNLSIQLNAGALPVPIKILEQRHIGPTLGADSINKSLVAAIIGILIIMISIGMAVDANILIFERMKEERRWGKSQGVALELGFKRAWTSIWASNASSLLTAVILYAFGTSIVRGFAITLAIGVLVSMFTAIVVTRTLLRLLYEFYKH